MTNRWNDAGASTLTMSTPWDSSWPRFLDKPRRNELLGWFENRFGISPRVFDGFLFLERPHVYWVVSDSPHIGKLARLKMHGAGVPALRKIQGHLKPTTAIMRMFGVWATQNVVPLDRQCLRELLHHGHVDLSLSIQPGYVILTHDKHILGCGLYTGCKLLNQIPRRYCPHL